MSADAISALLISSHGCLWSRLGGGVRMVGLTGRMMGGGLGVGLLALIASGFAAARLLCDSGIMSITVAWLSLRSGSWMTPRVSSASSSAPLTASASARPDARRLSGGRS
jgi:ABC-type multidrug transport system permease subunit